MNNTHVEQKFSHYVIPSMLSMLLCGFYSIIDGIFIGHAIGDSGLAAINIAWPITAVILATGTGIGTGGAALMSIQRGKNDLLGTNQALANTLLLLGTASVFLMIIFLTKIQPLLAFLGASEEIYTMAFDYSYVIVLGAAFQVFGSGLSPILRNDNRPKLAMAVMISGLITNIVLDALFVLIWEMGLTGAAWATVIAQGVTALPCIIYLWKKTRGEKFASFFTPHKETICTIIKIGISPFGISVIFGIIIVLNNWQCLAYGGATAVAAYTIVSYVLSPVQSLVNGIGEGAQPLVSYSYGANLASTLRNLLRKTLSLGLLVGFVLALITISFNTIIPGLFGASNETAEMVTESLFYLGLGLPCMAVVKVFSSYFYATKNMKYSTILIYGDACILTPLFLYLFPQIWGITGIWRVYPAVQGVLMIIALVFWYKQRAAVEYTTVQASVS